MKLNFKNTFFAILAMVGLLSCDGFFEKDVYVDIPEHEPKLVVNSIISEGDTAIIVYVTHSVGIKDNNGVSYALPDAEVTITINGTEYKAAYIDTEVDLDYYNENGFYYKLEYAPKVGDQIRIYVQADRYDPVSSEIVIPKNVEVSDVKFAGKRYDIEGWEYEAIRFHLDDLKDEDNYFELSMVVRYEYSYVEDDSLITYVNEYEDTYLYSPTPIFQEAPNGVVFNDDSFKDGDITLEIWTDNYYYSDDDSQLRLKVKTISKSYYEYMRLYEIHEWNQYPDLFSGEPVPMYNNIEGGYGIFGATSSVSHAIEP